MKIHKGNLSTSNAVVIGVLAIVLYFVMPGGSKEKRTGNTDQPVSEEPVATAFNTTASETSNTLPDQKQESSSTGNQRESGGLGSATAQLRPFMEIDQEKLQEITGRSPFCTTVVMIRSANASEADTAANEIAEPAPDEASLATELFSKSTVKLFYSSSTGTQAAVLNDDVVYQGTPVSDRLTVESIHSDGVRIRRSSPTPQTEK